MNNQDLLLKFTVDHPPSDIFKAINNVKAWSFLITDSLKNLILTGKGNPKLKSV
jgi:hypothetical protein